MDLNLSPYYRDETRDLAAADVPIRASGEYVVFEDTVPQNQVVIIKGFVPYVMERTDLGSSGVESAKLIPNSEISRMVSFEPSINNSSPHIIENNHVKMELHSATSDSGRHRSQGFSHVSSNPWEDAIRLWGSNAYNIVVPPESLIRVFFKVLAVGTNFSTYTVGSGSKRIDFAGCLVVGHIIPAQSLSKYRG